MTTSSDPPNHVSSEILALLGTHIYILDRNTDSNHEPESESLIKPYKTYIFRLLDYRKVSIFNNNIEIVIHIHIHIAIDIDNDINLDLDLDLDLDFDFDLVNLNVNLDLNVDLDLNLKITLIFILYIVLFT